MAILKPKSTENTQKNVKKQQPSENQKNAETEYKLSGAPVCTFILSGGVIHLPWVTPGVGKLFRTADRFQPDILQTGP